MGADGTTEEVVENILCEIRDHLANQDAEALTKSSKQLLDVSKPAQTMSILAPLLFRSSDCNNEKLSNHEALQVLGFLVASDTDEDAESSNYNYLKEASRAVKLEANRVAPEEMHVSPEFTSVLVRQLSSGKDVEAAQNALETVVLCCKKLGSDYTVSALQSIVEAWRNASSNNDSTSRAQVSTTCVRCATAVTEIALLHDSAMKAAIASSALDDDLFLGLLRDDSDPLLQMSMLDLVEKLATTQPMHHERAQWLFRSSDSGGVLQPILKLAGGLDDDDAKMDPVLGGPALRVVAALCKLGQQDAKLFGLADTELVNSFHRALHNFDGVMEMDRLALIDAISSFASASPAALNLVLDDPVTSRGWLSLAVAQPKLKSAILVSVARVLDPPPPPVDAAGDTVVASSGVQPITNESGMKLFAALGQNNGPVESTELVLQLARSPLPETRLGAYVLLKAVAKLPTGGQLLFTNGGFYEFLIGNRESEKIKEGREAKFEIVQTLLDSPVKGLLADDIVRALETYVQQGPHYVKTLNWELAEQ